LNDEAGVRLNKTY